MVIDTGVATLDAAAHASTVPVRAGLEIDAATLEAYLAIHVSGFKGPLHARQFRGGQSNPTYLISTKSAQYVLRRKPPGVLLASAHAVEREYRVMQALGAEGSVPVPRMHHLCMDATVIGTAFYVMEYVQGRILWDPALHDVARPLRQDHALAVVRALAALHRVDPVRAGLSDFGRPEGYVARQIARWSDQYLKETSAGRCAALDRLVEWLPAHIPAITPPSAIVHGDYRIDNTVFHPTAPTLLAILDWELATLGDPLADFAYHLMVYRLPSLSIPGLAGHDLTALGLPSESEYVSAYCEAAGIPTVPNLEFYLAYTMFRLAAIFHGIAGRVARGTAVSDKAREYAGQVDTMAEYAWRQAQSLGDA